MSAGRLAERLEVSRRTICRDLDALSAAGIPVVCDRGPKGGVYLLGGYRTDLTGLNELELEALLAFGGSGPAADLGLGLQLDQASRKLAAAAGSTARGRLQERVLIDSDRWFPASSAPPHLASVQDALWSDRRLRLRYRRSLERVVERTVNPYGLVCKAGTWYLLAGVDGELRTYRVSRIEDAEITEESFQRPPDFDLRGAWSTQVGRYTEGIPEPYRVLVKVSPEVSATFSRVMGDRVRGAGAGGVTELDFPACELAVSLLSAYGDAVEVLEPAEVRDRLAQLGRKLAALYGG